MKSVFLSLQQPNAGERVNVVASEDIFAQFRNSPPQSGQAECFGS
jgi:hypothetical protein